MLQHDYLLELIARFVETVAAALRLALEKGDPESIEVAEQAVGELVDLDPALALGLAPESLVTMMGLSGASDSVAEYAAYTLSLIADAYDHVGDAGLAEVRRQQAEAVANAYGCDLSVAPAGLEELS